MSKWNYSKERHKKALQFYPGDHISCYANTHVRGYKLYEDNKELTKNVNMGKINRVGGITSNWNFTAPRVEL